MTTIPTLKFPRLCTPKHKVEPDLAIFAYRGGPSYDRRKIAWGKVNDFRDELKTEVPARVPLLVQIHRFFTLKINCGEWGEASFNTYYKSLASLYQHSEELGIELTPENLFDTFRKWQAPSYPYSNSTAPSPGISARIATIISNILNIPPKLVHAHIEKSARRKSHFPTSPDTKIPDTLIYNFGHDLYDICTSLTYNRIYGELPVTIEFRSHGKFEFWGQLKNTSKIKALTSPELVRPYDIERALRNREKGKRSREPSIRGPFINLRLQAEAMIFISQTNLPPADIIRLERYTFRKTAKIDGKIRVECWKGRILSTISFTIYEEYWAHFQKFLDFRDKTFSKAETRLFPFTGKQGIQRKEFYPQLLKSIMGRIDRKYVTPTALRKHRLNYFARKAGLQAELTVGFHTRRTFFKHYNTLDFNTALSEWARFHSESHRIRANVLAGQCHGDSPKKIDVDEYEIEPDCKTPGGCVFCEHFCGEDSLDFIWSILSYREAKLFEKGNSQVFFRTKTNSLTAEIEQINRVISEFSSRSAQNDEWLNQAEIRISERSYHPHWRGFLKLYEELNP